MNVFAMSGLLTAVASGAMALLMFLKGTKLLHYLWGIFCITVILWGVGVYKIATTPDPDKAIMWWRIAYIGVIFIPVLFTHFVHEFLEIFRPKLIKVIYFLGFFFLVSNLLGRSFIGDVRWVFNQFYYIGSPTPIYTLFVIFFISLVIYTHLELLRAYRISSGIQKTQIKYFFIATAIGFGGGSIDYLPVYNIDIYPYFNLAIFPFSPIVAYAILKHRLMDVKVVATSTLVVSLWIVLFTRIFIGEITLTKVIFDIGVLGLSIFLGYLLIRSVLDEIKRREQIARLADQLKIANEHLKELDKMKTEFVSLASHELLTPISAIEGYLSMLLDEKIVAPQSPKGIEYLHRVYGASKRLAKLVTDLLNVSRIEEGRLLIQSKPLDINQIIDAVVGELRFKAKERGIELEFQPVDVPMVFADDDKLKEVIVNLVGNSIKYTTQGNVKVIVEVVSTAQIQAIDRQQQELLKQPDSDEALSHHIEKQRRTLIGERQLIVRVSDTGVGIPPGELANVFKKFYRIGDVTIQQTQGTGLGLYISRALVEMMHGRIWVESQGRGKGTTFSFSLPIAVYEPQIKEVEKDIKVTGTAKPLAHSSGFEF